MNVTTFTGDPSQRGFELFAREAFQDGVTPKLLLCSEDIAETILDWRDDYLLVSPPEEREGLVFRSVRTGHGTFLMPNELRLASNIPALALNIELSATLKGEFA